MQKTLECVMDIGEQLLISGAEVHRVEDTITRILNSFGATRVDVFGITSFMVVSVHMPDGEIYTETRRILSHSTDFLKLEQLNQLSRRICAHEIPLSEMRHELDLIAQSKKHSFWVECLMCAIVTAAFTPFFAAARGDFTSFTSELIIQTVISFFIGFGSRMVLKFSDSTVKNTFFSKFIATFFVTGATFLFLKLGAITKTDEIIIANIMPLIPGIALTNAIRDLFTGDSVAGILRLLESALVAISMAAGYFAFVFIGGIAV